MQVLSELQRDNSLERFRTEYEKLFKAVRKSHGERTSKRCTVTAIHQTTNFPIADVTAQLAGLTLAVARNVS